MSEIFKELDIKQKSLKRRITIERYSGNKKKQQQITERDHGRTLIELEFNDQENLIIRKGQIPKRCSKIKEVQFFGEDGTLLPKAVNAFVVIFNKFQVNNLMDACAVARFIDSCTHDNCTANDRRVRDIISEYSSQKN